MVYSSSLVVIVAVAVAVVVGVVDAQTTTSNKYDHYAGYLPYHSITDLAALDLDQYDINLELSDRKLLEAYHIYREGGHSGSFATLTLTNPETTAGNYPAGTFVWGQTERGENIAGAYLRDPAIWSTTTLNPVINVTYPVQDQQATYSDCTVGGLWRTSEADREGCFVGSGTIGIGDTFDNADAYPYDYNIRMDNNNDLTIQQLSLRAATNMKEFGNTYIREYQQFVSYYGDLDYADKYITAAYLGQHTNFQSGKGNIDFGVFPAGNRMGQGEAMKKGMAYLSVWMQVVLNIRTAADKCHDDIGQEINAEDEERHAVEFLDDAVALYTGSLVATKAEEQETGIFLHGLADARAHQFKTAGHQNNADTGTAYVNIKVMEGFRTLKQLLLNADPTTCDTAATTRDYIINLMKVPLVQGLLRYSYIREHELDNGIMSVDDQARTMAESATFAATLLPLVHTCDAKAAIVIHENTKLSSGHTVRTDYAAVHQALSSVYKCLGIDDCKLIGGVWDEVQQEYKSGGYPCGMVDPTLSSSHRSVLGHLVRFTFAMTFLVAVVYVLLKYKNRIWAYVRRVRKEHSMQKDMSPHPTSFSGNIAAVAEIS